MKKHFILICFLLPFLFGCSIFSRQEINPIFDETIAPDISGAGSGQVEKTPLVFTLPTSTPTGRELTAEDKETFEQNRLLGKGITLLLTQDEEMVPDQGVLPDDKYFQAIKDAGFTSVNIPMAWSYLSQAEAPYEIDPEAYLWLDPILEKLDKLDLTVVLYFAGFQEFEETPRVNTERFLMLWEQVADHYKNYPDNLFFGLYFIPSGTLSTTWNDVANQAIAKIRETNPERIVVLGETFFGPGSGPETLISFKLPENDRHLILYLIYFDPFQLTFYGNFGDGDGDDDGDNDNDQNNRPFPTMAPITWTATDKEVKEITDFMNQSEQFTRTSGRPLNLLAFGCSNLSDEESCAKWINAVARAAEEIDMSWSYFAFINGPLSAYDYEKDTWDSTVINALFPK
jgi:endoglucanase